MIDIAATTSGGVLRRDSSPSNGNNSGPPGRAGDVQTEASRSLRIAVIIITCQRPEVLRESLGILRSQTRRPHEIVVSATGEADVAALCGDERVRVVIGPKGACRQRNTAIRSLSPEIDIVVFFDDDFLPHPKWIEAAEQCFRNRPRVDCFTGYVIADGVKQGGLSFTKGMDLINRYRGEFSGYLEERYSPYGCNMAYRRSVLSELAFDERLVLYGWLEDRDFGAAVARRGGQLIKSGAAIGVHLGVSRGRLSGLRLGYSQVVNPVYILNKQNMSVKKVITHIVCNFGMNCTRCLFPDKHIDRAGRLAGNLLGFFDLLRGIVEPERAERLLVQR